MGYLKSHLRIIRIFLILPISWCALLAKSHSINPSLHFRPRPSAPRFDLQFNAAICTIAKNFNGGIVFEECFRVHRVNSTRMNGPAGRVFLIAGVHRTNAARTSRTICFRSLAVTYSGTMTRRRFDSNEKRKKKGSAKTAAICHRYGDSIFAIIEIHLVLFTLFHSYRLGRWIVWRGEGYRLLIKTLLTRYTKRKRKFIRLTGIEQAIQCEQSTIGSITYWTKYIYIYIGMCMCVYIYTTSE